MLLQLWAAAPDALSCIAARQPETLRVVGSGEPCGGV